LLEATRAAGVKRLVFSSTAAVYGEPEEVPVTEEGPTAPTNPYGGSKLAADHLIGYEAVAHRLAAVSLRCFNFVGASGRFGNPDASSTQIIPATLRVAAGRGDAVEIFGTDYPTPDGTAVRDFIHVEDLARPPPGTRSGRGGKTEDLQRRQRRGLHRQRGRRDRPPGHEKVHKGREIAQASGGPGGRRVLEREDAGGARWKPEKPDLETMISDAWNWIQLHPHEYVPRSARD
jgi:UDP-glucose 4-epimerase